MDDENTSDGIDRDTFHNLLSSSRRRSVVKHLHQHGSLDKGELATLVAADEVNKNPNDLEGDERKRVLISLQQQHLDTLEEKGVIERERDIVKQGPNFDEMIEGIIPQKKGRKTINLTLENATINIQAEIPDDL